MPESTNKLVKYGVRFAAPAALVGAFALGAAMFVGHGSVHAAGDGQTTPPVNPHSVTALTQLDQAMEAVAAKVTPSVVNIAVTSRVTPDEGQQEGQLQNLPPGWAQFFGMRPPQQQPQIEHGIGSGVIISPDGYIVTNNHVVQGATQIRVTLHDRRILTAKLIGTDKLTDLAVIKINATNLPTIAWGDSSKLQPGQTVLAFGSPFGYLQFSVTRGIVSALNRPNIDSTDARKPGDYIQTDAAINPGNSGGPLVNAYGELVGINNMIYTNSGSFEGAGFAIPSQLVHAITKQLIEHGKVEHGYIGITMNDVTPANARFFNLKEAMGAIVSQVTPDSPASRAGLKTGDVITELNGKKMGNGSALQVAVSELTPGTQITLGIMRNGSPMTIHITLGHFNGNSETADNEGGSGSQKGRLGVTVGNLNDQARQQFNIPDQVHGAVIEAVRPGSPADDAGLQPGDVILEVNRHTTSTVSQFIDQVHQSPAGQDLLLLVWSKGGASFRTVHPDAGSSNQ